MSTPKQSSYSSSGPNNSVSRKDNLCATLTRQDIALAVFGRCEGLSRRECKRLVDLVIEQMSSTLIQGETLKLHDFGSFTVREKHPRIGRNPRTGAKVPIERRKVVVFKASPNLRSVVNGEAPAGGRRQRRAAGEQYARLAGDGDEGYCI